MVSCISLRANGNCAAIQNGAACTPCPPGQQALVVGRDVLVEGVFASLTGHILSSEQRGKDTLDWNDLFVDAFFSSREEALAAGVHIGDRIIWNPPTRAHGKLYSGKAMDNRVSLALLEELLPRLDVSRLNYDLYIASSVMEEGGLYGAHSVHAEVGCEYAIAIDTGLSGGYPRRRHPQCADAPRRRPHARPQGPLWL